MEPLPHEAILQHLLAAFREGLKGPAEGPAYFSDHSPDAGLRALLEGVSAEEASAEIGGNSVAGHVHHLAFGFRASAAWLRGDRTRPDWAASWAVSSVDADAWAHLQADLAAAHDDLVGAMGEHALDAEIPYAISLGNIAHLAYHLGAVRQKIRVLREPS